MALQMNIPLPGGIEHANGYVRVTDVRVCKKDNADDWFMMVDVAVYKDADERAKFKSDDPDVNGYRISAPAVDKFKFAYTVGDEGSSSGGIVMYAYAKLKTHDTFKGKTTDV